MALQKAVSPVQKDAGLSEQNASSGVRPTGALGFSGYGENQAETHLLPAVSDDR